MKNGFKNTLQDMKTWLIIYLFSLSNVVAQTRGLSILEVFQEDESNEVHDYHLTIESGNLLDTVKVDSNRLYSFAKLGYDKSKVTLTLRWRDHLLEVSDLNPISFIGTHITILITEQAADSCLHVSHYYSDTVIPAIQSEGCPDGHDINFMDIPLISENQYDEADSIAKAFGIPLEFYWFDGTKFVSELDYLKWIRQRRKN